MSLYLRVAANSSTIGIFRPMVRVVGMVVFRWSWAAASGPSGAGCARASKARVFWMLQCLGGAVMWSAGMGADHPCCTLKRQPRASVD